MESNKQTFTSIDEYIAAFPEEVQKQLKEIRAVIKAAAPEAEEKISYQMPTFVFKGNLVYFAANKKHIGFYGSTDKILASIPELAGYKTSKGTLQFPHNKPLPLELISRIVKFRVAENLQKAETQKNKRK
jgi:uncharacterized protein YdhG (YjbR/CyaY superfamily)